MTSTSTAPAQEPEGINLAELTREDAERAFADGFDEALHELGRFNLAIVGDAGVGKSSLVNAIFGEGRAKTGIGAPITKGSDYYLNDAGTFGVWDFEGFEHGTAVPPLASLTKSLRKIQEAGDGREIHIAWFCWDASSARVTEGHRILIRALTDAGIPVIGVLTKVHTRDGVLRPQHAEFAEWIEGESLGLADPRVYPTAAVHDPWGFPRFGLQELLDATLAIAPEAVRDAARAAQRIDLQAKTHLARKWIAGSSASAAAAAATPLPLASAVVLAPIQMGMFGKIATTYESTLRSTLGSSSAVLQLALEFTGKAAAQSLIKVIPGAGSVINAAVAFTWTLAAGESWRLLCEKIYTGAIDPKNIDKMWAEYLPIAKELFMQWMSKGPAWAK